MSRLRKHSFTNPKNVLFRSKVAGEAERSLVFWTLFCCCNIDRVFRLTTNQFCLKFDIINFQEYWTYELLIIKKSITIDMIFAMDNKMLLKIKKPDHRKVSR